MVFEVEAPTEGILSQEKDAELFLNRETVGRGDFYVTERDVVFIGPQRKLRLEYNTISVHAISKDNSNFPNQHCIFMIVNEQDVQHVDEPEIRYFKNSNFLTRYLASIIWYRQRVTWTACMTRCARGSHSIQMIWKKTKVEQVPHFHLI